MIIQTTLGQQIIAAREYYDGYAQAIAHGIKQADFPSIVSASAEMAAFVNKNDLLVPMPSHTGRATATLELATLIASRVQASVADALTGCHRVSLYEHEKRGGLRSDIELGLQVDVAAIGGFKGRIIVIDNAAHSGATAQAAEAAFKRVGLCATVLVYAAAICESGVLAGQRDRRSVAVS